MGIDPCSENGEFHTFVVDGPLFKQPVNIGFGKVWSNKKILYNRNIMKN